LNPRPLLGILRSRAARALSAQLPAMLVLVATLPVPSTVSAQTTGRVTEYGIHSAERKLLTQTREIPIRSGVRFGFCFEVPLDSAEDSTMLVETLAHPPVRKRGIDDTGYSVPRMFSIEDGRATGCARSVARSASDLAAGRWKFSVSDGGGDLVVQEFIVR